MDTNKNADPQLSHWVFEAGHPGGVQQESVEFVDTIKLSPAAQHIIPRYLKVKYTQQAWRPPIRGKKTHTHTHAHRGIHSDFQTRKY